ncbi:glutamate receptor ionotropic, delta-2-like [Panulirus ornatus]|uniref:glutamate receptor ionotropic, delta-2-like n=1 Tax=Panulirus ornatus TaxID=150431 RepID=UPI003A85EB8F
MPIVRNDGYACVFIRNETPAIHEYVFALSFHRPQLVLTLLSSLTALYSGTLTAVLAITSYEKPIDSLHDLAQAHRQGFTLSTIRDSSYLEAFESAKSGIYHEVWQLFNHEDPELSFVTGADVGFEMVLNHKYVFINGEFTSELRASQLGRGAFHLGRQTFLPDNIAIACSTGSPLRDVFSSVLLQLRDAGLVDKFAQEELHKVNKFVSTGTDDAGPRAITLNHLQAAFFIVAVGVAISTAVLGAEVMTHSRRQRG